MIEHYKKKQCPVVFVGYGIYIIIKHLHYFFHLLHLLIVCAFLILADLSEI